MVTDHKNLEYFTTTKLLTWHQAWWSEYLSQFNMVIHFHPGKLGAKPNTLTRQWDIYHKGGNSDFAMENPSDLCPIFTNKQLTSSLQATYFTAPLLCSAIIMDIEQLHNTIQKSYSLDPITAVYFQCISDPKWTIDKSGLLHCNDCIYIPDANDLWLKILQYKHNHILSGHLGQNKTFQLVQWDYMWPNLWTLVQHFCNTCMTWKCSKALRHKPYGFLKQLLVPERPWNSISMDFIKHLLAFSSYTSILVIVDQLSKQGIFIPTVDDITTPQVAKSFVVHIFSKHRVPLHVTCDCVSEFVSTFSVL